MWGEIKGFLQSGIKIAKKPKKTTKGYTTSAKSTDLKSKLNAIFFGIKTVFQSFSLRIPSHWTLGCPHRNWGVIGWFRRGGRRQSNFQTIHIRLHSYVHNFLPCLLRASNKSGEVSWLLVSKFGNNVPWNQVLISLQRKWGPSPPGPVHVSFFPCWPCDLCLFARIFVVFLVRSFLISYKFTNTLYLSKIPFGFCFWVRTGQCSAVTPELRNHSWWGKVNHKGCHVQG